MSVPENTADKAVASAQLDASQIPNLDEIRKIAQGSGFTLKLKDGASFTLSGGGARISAPFVLISPVLNSVESGVDQL